MREYRKSQKGASLALRLLLRGVVGTNDLCLVGFILGEGIATVAFETLDPTDLVDSLSESIHTWAIIWQVVLLDLLYVMIANRGIHTLHTIRVQ